MAGLRDLLKGESDNGEKARDAVKALQKDFPFVFELLGGLPATKTQEAVAPSAVSVWVSDGRARFSANVKSLGKTIIGDVADVVNLWQSINYVLEAGEVSSKRYTERTNGLTDEQKSLLL